MSNQNALARAVVVDDDEVNLYYAGKILRNSGFHVVSVDNYLGALEALTGAESDVLVADIRLARGNGLELARLARERQPNLKILLMTAYRDEEFKGSHAGYPVLRIPFSSRQLLTGVRQLSSPEGAD